MGTDGNDQTEVNTAGNIQYIVTRQDGKRSATDVCCIIRIRLRSFILSKDKGKGSV